MVIPMAMGTVMAMDTVMEKEKTVPIEISKHAFNY